MVYGVHLTCGPCYSYNNSQYYVKYLIKLRPCEISADINVVVFTNYAQNGTLTSYKKRCFFYLLVLPYIVDENTLEKSSKQPKFVRNRDLSAYDADANDDEWKPRGYCRHSIYIRTISS